jgi:hypothetical protein
VLLRSTDAYWGPAANSRAGCVRPKGIGEMPRAISRGRVDANLAAKLDDGPAFFTCIHPASSSYSARPSMVVLSPGSSSRGGSGAGQLVRLAFGIVAALTVAGRRRVRTASAPIETGFLR